MSADNGQNIEKAVKDLATRIGESTEVGTFEERYIEFGIGEEEYAIPLLTVREVISPPETTPIPKAPKHFIGLMNLRGQVISIVDLRIKLGIKPKEDKREEAVIIVKIGEIQLGVVVDSINKVLAFKKEDISQLPEIQTQVNAEYIVGVHRKEESLTILLDIAKTLDVKDLSVINSGQMSS